MDNAHNESGFRLERATDAGDFVEIAITTEDITTFTDTTAVADRSYRYRVQAFNSAGASGYSNIARRDAVVTPRPVPTISPITDVSRENDGAVVAVTFGISDVGAVDAPWIIAATSSNQALLPDANLIVGSADGVETLLLTPIPGQSGTATITLTATDGVGSVSQAFTFVVNEPPPPPPESRLLNVSSRVFFRPGQEPLIAGFVVNGAASKRVLLRAVGPTLSDPPFNLAGTLANPRMMLKRWDGVANVDFASNDDWGTNADLPALLQASAESGAFGLTPGSRDAALLVDLPAGQYTLIVDDPDGIEGTVIVEMFDADRAGLESSITNMSNRGYVRGEDQIMISGFVVSAGSPQTLLIRAIGPGLTAEPYRVRGMNGNPRFDLYRRNENGSESLVVSQDDWGIDASVRETAIVAAQVFAFPVSETSLDAATVVTVEPGVYTVVVRGVDNASGTVVVEVYAVD